MNPWPFVTAAYTLTGLAAAALAAWSYFAMVRAERHGIERRGAERR